MLCNQFLHWSGLLLFHHYSKVFGRSFILQTSFETYQPCFIYVNEKYFGQQAVSKTVHFYDGGMGSKLPHRGTLEFPTPPRSPLPVLLPTKVVNATDSKLSRYGSAWGYRTLKNNPLNIIPVQRNYFHKKIPISVITD